MKGDASLYQKAMLLASVREFDNYRQKMLELFRTIAASDKAVAEQEAFATKSAMLQIMAVEFDRA